MRLLIFLDTDHLSGPARLALDFARHVRGLGHDVLMLGLVRGARPESTAFSRAMEEAGIPTRLLHERRRFDPRVVAQFRAIVQSFRPDLYQSHGYKGSLLGRRARRMGVPWQAVFHGFTWENWRVRLYHWLDVRWLRGADEVVAVSRGFEHRLAADGVSPARLRWVPNAIDEAALRATDSDADLRREWFGPPTDADAPIVAGVLGRFSPEKAPDVFLRAFQSAAASQSRLHAVMVGDGPLLEQTRRDAAKLDCADRLILPGFRRDLAAIYRAIDMLVIPSRSEGMPTVMIEAMLMGVPVISTRVGAVPDVLSDGGTGLLVAPEDPAALAAAIVRLAGDPGLRSRLAAAARQLARERLTVAQRADTLLDHARCILDGRPIPEVIWDPPQTDPAAHPAHDEGTH
jgi:glycosyltransferase involved in cell wall biosynthesis